MEERVIQLLGDGVPAHVVAASVGCDPSYISQLGAREDIAQRIAELRAEKAAGMVEHDGKITSLEKKALEKLDLLLPLQTDLMKVLKVFQVANAARKSSDVGVSGLGNQPQTVVSIQLPQAAHVHFKLTSDQQVIEIEGRSMVPLPSHQVAAKLRELKAARLLESTDAVLTPKLDLISARSKSIVDQL